MAFIDNDPIKVGTITSVRAIESPTTVVDIEVSNNHNFFVSPDADQPMALVHNCHKAPALASSRVLASFNVRIALGLSGTPARKCFHPNTMVTMEDGSSKVVPSVRDGDHILSPQGGLDTVSGSFNRSFEGSLVTLKTESGRSLSVTPDHMILTQLGWVQSHDLDPSIHLVAVE